MNAEASPAVPTIDGQPIPEIADRVRMRAQRHAKLQARLETSPIDALVLIGTQDVTYAVGPDLPACDPARSMLARPAALVVAGEDQPYLRTPYPEGAPRELPADRIGPAVYPDLDEGASELATWVAERVPRGATIGTDEITHAMRRAFQAHGLHLSGSAAILTDAKLAKTVDEVACIRAAQRITEAAMTHVMPMLRPGVQQHELTATFLRRVFEAGVENVGVDPIWQPVTALRADMPTSIHGDIGFPVATTTHTFADRDVLWNDTGLHVGGYASDFGRTWIIGDNPKPGPRQQNQCDRWRAIVAACIERSRPGVDTLQLARLAIEMNQGVTPWLKHFYLAHGIGVSSAELPMIGTDLGEAFDEQQVLAPGQILVFEPVIWDEGEGGYRAEEVVVVTDNDALSLCDFPFTPFEGPT